jgi:BON domain
MKTFVFAITLASAAALVAQQTPSQASSPSGQPQQQPTPYQSQTTSPNPQTLPDKSPQTLPQQSPQTLPNQSATTPNQQMPRGEQPPTAVPDSSASSATSSAQVQQQIQQGWQSQSALSNLNAEVTGTTITLGGTVRSEEEHQKALQIANQKANGMQVVDNIKVQPQ